MGANDKAWAKGYEHGINQCKHHHGDRVERILEKLSEANREVHSVTNRLDDSLLSWKSQQRDLDDLRRTSIDTEGILRSQLIDEHAVLLETRAQLARVQTQLETSEAAEVAEGLRYSELKATQETAEQRIAELHEHGEAYVEQTRVDTRIWRKRVSELKEQVNDLQGKDAQTYGHLREQIDNLTEKNGNQYDIIKGHHVLQEKGELLRAAEGKIVWLKARIIDEEEKVERAERKIRLLEARLDDDIAKLKKQHLRIKNGRLNERDMKVRITKLNILITDSKVDKGELVRRIDVLSAELVNQAEQFDEERERVAATGIRAWANRVRFDEGKRKPVSERSGLFATKRAGVPRLPDDE